jgi:hypothetical protein
MLRSRAVVAIPLITDLLFNMIPYQAAEQLRKMGSDAGYVPLSALYTLSADSKALYHMLGLSGRSREQVLLHILV